MLKGKTQPAFHSANTQPGKELFEGRVPESEGRVPDGEGQEDALGDLQKLSQAGRATDPRKELSLLKASMGGFKLAYYLMTEEPFRSLQNFVQSDRTIVVLVWETGEKREIATGWSRLHRVDDSG